MSTPCHLLSSVASPCPVGKMGRQSQQVYGRIRRHSCIPWQFQLGVYLVLSKSMCAWVLHVCLGACVGACNCERESAAINAVRARELVRASASASRAHCRAPCRRCMRRGWVSGGGASTACPSGSGRHRSRCCGAAAAAAGPHRPPPAMAVSASPSADSLAGTGRPTRRSPMPPCRCRAAGLAGPRRGEVGGREYRRGLVRPTGVVCSTRSPMWSSSTVTGPTSRIRRRARTCG